MKTNLINLHLIILLLFAFILNTVAIEPTKSIIQENPELNLDMYGLNSSDVNLKLLNIQFDPLGFIFFGPQLNVDVQLADMIAIGPYVRWNYAGLLYQAFITDWFSDAGGPEAGSYGIGVNGKFIPPVGTGKHRPYIEIGYEKFKGKESYDPEGSLGKHYYEYKANIFHFGAGYRMVTEGSFNLSVGFFIAIEKETENFDYYELESTKDYNDLEDPQIFPGLQLMLGWQFGN